MNGLDRKRLLNEIDALCYIPDFAKAIYHKAEELKHILYNDIETYRPIIEMLIPLQPGTFELLNYDGEWHAPPTLPATIVNYIVNNARPGIISMCTYKFKDNLYDLHFECSAAGDSITGTINAKVRPPDTKQHPEQTIKPKSTNYDPKQLEELFNYIQSNDLLYKHFTQEFYQKWKPLIDNERLQQK